MPLFSNTLALLAQAAAGAPPKPPEAPSSMGPEFFIVIAVVILLFIFLIDRPARKEQEARLKALEQIKKGQKVVLSGGIHGVVHRASDDAKRDTVFVTIAKDTVVEVNRTSLTIIPDAKEGEKSS